MSLKDYSDNEAVRSRGQDLVSTLVLVVVSDRSDRPGRSLSRS